MISAAPMLEVRRLAKRFPPRRDAESPWILADLSFHVAEREFLTMVGPSGAGKSTLLNIIAQVDGASDGEVFFRGSMIDSSANGRALNPGWNCQIGYVTQDDNLLPWRTLIENVTLPLKLQGRYDEAAKNRVAELFRATNLTGFERYYPHELSGGMRKRGSLIRTLAYDPPIILMDEPFSAVDAQTRTQLQQDLLRLWNFGRKTIVFVTHDIAEAIALGDRVLVLSKSPAKVIADHRVDIKRPRDLGNVFKLQGFGDIFERVRRDIQ